MGYKGGVDPLFKEIPMSGPHLQNGSANQRHSMSKKTSKKNFTKQATNTNKKNFVSGVMRGGIRF